MPGQDWRICEAAQVFSLAVRTYASRPARVFGIAGMLENPAGGVEAACPAQGAGLSSWITELVRPAIMKLSK